MKKQAVLIPIILITSIVLSACTMSASTPPPVTPTTNLSEIARQATQTAIAKTPKAGETQAPDGTETAQETPAETSAAEPTAAPNTATPTSSPATETAGDVTTEYAVPDTYTVKSGEHAYCLGRRWNIHPDDMLAVNGLGRDDILYPGLSITVPNNARSFPGQRPLRFHPDTYTVQPDDTLYSIACYYGDVDPRAIAAANDIDIDQSLTSGQTLQIP